MNTFWQRVEKTESCWLWKGGKSANGYGAFRLNRRQTSAHRVAWLFSGRKIPKGKFVLHRCDTKLCVNPDHLFLGSQKDNMRDMISKGRKRVLMGEALPQTKLKPYQIREIRHLRAEGLALKPIAVLFRVTASNICKILKGVSWRHA